MSTDHTLVLNKKIECASFDISIYPRLDELVSILSKVCVEAVSGHVQTTATFIKADSTMRSQEGALEGVAEDSAFYWISDNRSEEAVLVCLSPNFVCALSECLLGGAFQIGEEGVALTTLDLELSQSLAHECRTLLSRQLTDESGQQGIDFFSSLRNVKEYKEVFKGKDVTALFSVAVDLNINEIETDKIIRFYFPIEFLEGAGFLETKRSQGAGSLENSQWFNTMRRNILQSSIELPITFDRYTTTVGELSRLSVGQMIPVNKDAHQKLSIEMATDAENVQIGLGRLGTMQKNKAVKITKLEV